MTKNVSRLMIARRGMGLSQVELAKLVAVSEVTISRIETGRLTPKPELKRLIAEAIGKPTFELFDW